MRTPSLAAIVALLAANVSAQTPGPTPKPTPWAVAGRPFAVNTTRTDEQRDPSVGIGKNAGFVVVWSSSGQDGNGSGIFARRFDKVGAGITGEFQVNTTTTGFQDRAAVGADAAGNFVVVWEGPDGSGETDIFARRYDADGNPLGNEFQVNTFTTGFQVGPRVAASEGYPFPDAGGFVVVWSSFPAYGGLGEDGDGSGVFGRRYGFDGNPVTGAFLVNTYTTGDQRNPNVSMGLYDGTVVVWDSEGQDGNLTGILARIYDDAGNPVGGEFPVNAYTTGKQLAPDVAVGPGGDFFVTWKSISEDNSSIAIFAQHFLDATTPLGPEFQVNTHTPTFSGGPRVARDQSTPGDFVVVWQGYEQDEPGSSGIFAQRFSNAPVPSSAFFLANPPRRGSNYQINTYTTNRQGLPHVAMTASDRFVIVWESFGQDGEFGGIFARRFNSPDAAPMTVDGSPSGGPSNLNGVLEAGERVVVAPSWINTYPPIAPLPLHGAATGITGPVGPVYTIDNADANYANIPPGATGNCWMATSDCYEITVSGVRPAAHWDATFDEILGSAGPLGPNEPMQKTWSLHVGGSFPDVPQTPFYPFIENLFHNGITGGCAGGGYCPDDDVTRAQMAVFLLKSKFGSVYAPPEATGAVFTDVPASNPFAPWIENLAALGITGGCGGGLYCPNTPVTRQQMAVLLLKTKYGSAYAPPAGTGIFGDVSCPGLVCDFVEALYNSGITGGCQASPLLYCPSLPNLRQEMAVFLVKLFELQLYGPD